MYAVVSIAGHQIKVDKGLRLRVPRLAVEAGPRGHAGAVLEADAGPGDVDRAHLPQARLLLGRRRQQQQRYTPLAGDAELAEIIERDVLNRDPGVRFGDGSELFFRARERPHVSRTTLPACVSCPQSLHGPRPAPPSVLRQL